MTTEHPDPKQKWKNMRRMAWLAMIHALAIPFYIEKEMILMPVLAFDGAVVGAYMGFSSWRDGFGDK